MREFKAVPGQSVKQGKGPTSRNSKRFYSAYNYYVDSLEVFETAESDSVRDSERHNNCIRSNG